MSARSAIPDTASTGVGTLTESVVDRWIWRRRAWRRHDRLDRAAVPGARARGVFASNGRPLDRARRGRGITMPAMLIGMFFAAFGQLSWANVAEQSPRDRVQIAVDEVVKILRDPALPRRSRWAGIGEVLNRSFDFEQVSKNVLSSNWRQATATERARFVDYFSQYIEATFGSRMEAFTDERVDILKETIEGDRAVVETVVLQKGKRVPVLYKLRFIPPAQKRVGSAVKAGWWAYDVVIEGVSLVSSYRDTFAAIVKTEGMNGLLNDVQQRINRYQLQSQ